MTSRSRPLSVRTLPTLWTLQAFCVLWLFGVVGCGGGGASEPERVSEDPVVRDAYHVVLLVVDTLRADALGVSGSGPEGPISSSPHLDRLMDESVRFDLAVAPATWTRPSMASLLTSTWPSEHGLLDLKDGSGKVPELLDEKLDTLAESLSGAGWQSVGIVNQIYLQYKYGFGQGFEHYEGWRGKTAFQILNRFRIFLDERRDESRPLFAYLHVLDPHWRYDRRLKELPADAFGPADGAVQAPSNGSELQAWAEGHLDEAGLATLHARYLHEVAWTDAAIGALRTELEERGLWDRTLLVVTSDHGESFWEREQLLHGTDPYDELLRVPLVVRVPPAAGVPAGVVHEPVSLVDVLPTVLDLVGAPAQPSARGRSLVRAMVEGDRAEERLTFFDTERSRGVRSRTMKLLARFDGRTEFYRLDHDPGETRDLSADCGAECRRLAAELRTFTEGLEPIVASARAVAPTVEERAELEALGYLSD